MLKESFSEFPPRNFIYPFLELHKRADSDTPAKYPYSCCCHNRELEPENTTNSSAHNENYVQVKYHCNQRPSVAMYYHRHRLMFFYFFAGQLAHAQTFGRGVLIDNLQQVRCVSRCVVVLPTSFPGSLWWNVR